MFGIALIALGSLFSEIAVSIGKIEVLRKKESVYTMGFLNLFWSTILLAGIAVFVPESFRFSFASLPFLVPRICLEILQAHISVLAIIYASRSSFGFIRTITIPLLLLVDVVLGYTIGARHLIGMGLIFVTILLLFMNGRIKKAGAGFVLFSAVNAVITISLYKYNITHFNSVVAEQLIVHFFILLYFSALAKRISGENPIKFLKKRIFFFQSFSEGAGTMVMSFAYIFAPASIILAGKRACEILWAIVSGNRLFNEHHLAIKILTSIMLTGGIILLL